MTGHLESIINSNVTGGVEGKLGPIHQELSLGIHSIQEKIKHLQVRLVLAHVHTA